MDMVVQVKLPADPRRDAEFDRAFESLRQFVDWSQMDQKFPVRENAVYTTSVVLWMLVYQRMSSDASLEAAVQKLLQAKPAFLPPNKQVRENTLSSNTGGYSRARQRLPKDAAQELARLVSQSLIDVTPPAFQGRRLYLLDGTTMTLAPEPALRRKFPPASNQHGPGVWPVALLVMAHELSSGAALLPALGAMYGNEAVSETALVRPLLDQMPADAIVMADAGFGIFAVAWEVRQSRRDFVLRLSKQRFQALCRQGTEVARGEGWRTYAITWRPSAKERQTHPDLPREAVLEVRVHEVRLHAQLDLYLVTNLPNSALCLSDLYRHRQDAEIDIRNFKVVLKAEQSQARSESMFSKELYMSLVAYNLVSQFRCQAAALIQQPPRALSFKRTWTTFREFLLTTMYTEGAAWREQYGRALGYAMQNKLPKRPGRSFEREAYQRRPKSAQFKTRKPRDIPQPSS